jgi:ABC-type antimicrobial peptide transport system permease subunit
MPLGIVAAARAVPEVESAMGIGTVETQVDGSNAPISAIDPAAATSLVNFDWRDGGSNALLDQLGSDGAVIEESFAQDRALKVGSTFEVEAIDGQRATFTVKGIYRDPQLFTGYTITTEGLRRLTETPTVAVLLTKLRPGVDLTVGTAQLNDALTASYPTAKVRTRSEYKDFINTQLSVFLYVLYALLALSVIISLIGVIITLLLAIYERTREIGMMRAVGTTRGQVRAMILHEGVITCLIGGIVGLFVGLLLGGLVTKGLESEGIAFSVPYVTLVVVLVLTIFAGLIAAFLPAMRAAKLRPLDALQYE